MSPLSLPPLLWPTIIIVALKEQKAPLGKWGFHEEGRDMAILWQRDGIFEEGGMGKKGGEEREIAFDKAVYRER